MLNTKLVKLSFFVVFFASAGAFAGDLDIGIPNGNQDDGNLPFDTADPALCPGGAGDATLNGADCGEQNLVVRTQDTVSTTFSVTSNNTATNEVILVHNIDLSLDPNADVFFDRLPAVCLQAGDLLDPTDPTSTVTTPSSFTATTLTCNLGNFIGGEQKSVTTDMRVSGNSQNAAVFTANANVFTDDTTFPSTTDALTQDTFTISAGPQYDLDVTTLSPWPTCAIVQVDRDDDNNPLTPDVTESGWSCTIVTQIFTEEPFGNAALTNSFDYSYDVTATNGSGGTTPYTIAQGFDFALTSCQPNDIAFGNTVGGNQTIGAGGAGFSTNNSVTDSGACTFTNLPSDGSSDIDVTVTGADTSGDFYPSERVNGANLAAGPFFVTSHSQSLFIPFSAVDAQDGVLDGSGAIDITVCAVDFDPNSAGGSGVSNFGTGNEPGFAGTDNNCNSRNLILSAEGNFAKWNWGFMRETLEEGDDIISSSLHAGDGVVEPGQYYTAMVRFNNNGTAPLNDVVACDFFDNTTQVISPVTTTSGATFGLAEIARNTTGGFDFQDWRVQYTSISTAGDNPQAGPIDPATGRFPGDWPVIMNARCDDAGLVWYDDPNLVPGGIDAINGVRALAIDPSTTSLNAGGALYLLMGMNARDTYYNPTGAGPNTGPIPIGTILPNFGGVMTSTLNGGAWTAREYDGDVTLVPNDGDRFTLTRAELRLSKETLDPLAGVDDNSQVIVAGDQIIWQLNPVVNSVVTGTILNTVTVIDVLPPEASYNDACTIATPGGVSATTVGADLDVDGNPAPGFTRLTWVFNNVPANTVLTPIIFCTDTDGLALDNTPVVNYAEIRSPESLSDIALRSDEHIVTLEQENNTTIIKTVDNALDPTNDDQVYQITWENFSPAIFEAPTVIDVFSYNGDSGNLAPRSPGSNFTPSSTLQLTGPATVTFLDGSATPGLIEYTNAAPATVSHDPNNNTVSWCATPGSGGADCPATFADATAIRFTSAADLAIQGSAQSGQILTYTVQANGNASGDFYANRAGLDSDTLALDQVLLSNTVVVEVEGGLGADLALTKDDGITNTQVGNTLTYTLSVTNNGPAASGVGVTITDTMPADLTVNAGAAGALALSGANAADWVCNSDAASPQVISCTYAAAAPGIAVGATSAFSFATDGVVSTSAGLTLVNNAVVNPDPSVPDPDSTNNDDAHPVTVDVLAAVIGTVWFDTNNDNVIDPGEPLLENWTVNVLDANGNVINDVNGNPATRITAADGTYSIPDLPPGSYTVEFVDPDGNSFEQEQVTLPANQTVVVPLPIIDLPQQGNVILSKSANKTDVLIGDLVQYTLEARNDSNLLSIANAQVVDNLPAGFAYVDSTANAFQAGPDGVFGTGDDIETQLSSSGIDPVTFSSLNFAPSETIIIRYLVSVSTGVSRDGGDYINVAQITDATGVPISNEATAAVRIDEDPLLEQTTIIGKVFHDRDQDGFQDNADATDIKITSANFGESGYSVGNLKGRIRITDPLDEHQASIRMPYSATGDNSFVVNTREGSVINVDNSGDVTYNHSGLMARGMSGQDLKINLNRDGNDLVIGITNHGIHDEGIPGVRLATVEGLLIETDQFGRYHIAGVDTGSFSYGTNYIVKVDDATLPEGSTFTTENPRVQRLTQSLMTRFNFGVDLPDMIVPVAQQCEQKYETYTEGGTTIVPRTLTGLIDPVRFASGKSQIPDGYVAELRQVIAGYTDKQNLRIRFTGHTDNERLSAATAAKYGSNQGLSEARATLVSETIVAALGMPDLPVSIEGYGDTQPLASNATAAGMAQNRRVEVELVYDEVVDNSVQKTRPVGESCSAAPVPQMAEKPVVEMVTQSLANAVDPVRFASGKSQIPAGFVDELRTVIGGLEDKQNVRIRFSGHTDNERLGPATAAKYGDNLGLSKARAQQVADVITQGLGMPNLPVEVDGFADTQPLASNATRDGMALNRRVEIEVLYDEAVTRMAQVAAPAAPTARSITLPHGGVIWATEDPAKVDPRLDIMANGPLVVDGDSKIAPVSFTVYSNYQAFIETYTITIYAADDTDLALPLTEIVGRVPHFDKPIEWDGYLQNEARPEPGEHLVYVMEVSNGKGHTDRTAPQLLRVVDASVLTHEHDSDADRTYGATTLVQQSIPLTGSRVRLHGEDIDRNYTLMINEQQVVIGDDNNFVYEQQLPMGDHHFDIAVSNSDGVTWDRDVDVTVDGGYLFLVAIANLTIGDNSVSGDIAPLGDDHRFEGDSFIDGRVAAYLKGKFSGKYLLTAQIDTTEDDIDNLGSNLGKKDPRSVFRRLDPDQYYPVYGDDSTTISDVDTQGAFYLRVDWDKNRALWGNYNTQITGTEYGQYNRSLYGANFVHESLKTNDYGDSKTALHAFISEAQTANAHNEYLATGGSLYYLRETDIVRGSEKVWVEVRARDTERVVDLIPLEEGRDYQIDYLQGRIILNRPLTQVASQSAPSIIKDQALEGDDVILAVDYEFVPRGFSGDDITAGVRGKGWLGNAFGIGATAITEERSSSEDYTLNGIDVTFKAAEGTWLRAEYAESESTQSNTWLSSNGGLSFASVLNAANGAGRSGDAVSIEGQINLAEYTDGALDARINAWYKDRDADFSSTRTTDGIETSDIGFEASYENELFAITARANELERDTATTRTANLQAKAGINDLWSVIGELRYEDSDQSNTNLGFTGDGDVLLGAIGVEYNVNAHTAIWGSLQSVISDNDRYLDNDAFTLGARSQFTQHLAASAEVTSGDRGDALNLGIDWSVSDNVNLQLEGGFGDVARSQVGSTFTTAGGLELYGSYAVDTDRTDNEQQRLTFGQSKRYGDGSRVFAEQLFSDDKFESGITNIYGIEHSLTEQMNVSASLQTSSIDTAAGDIDRNAGSIGFDYNDGRTIKASTRLEYREDSGSENTTQWLTTNALDWKQSEELRWLLRLNLSVTENDDTNKDDGEFVEADIGFAYRPISNDRLNILGKYSYLYDLPASLASFSSSSLVGQNDSTADQRMHVFSIEALYDLSRKWEIGAKLATRQSETRALRGEGRWFDNGANLAALRARYHVIDNWDALIEYHILTSEAGDDERDGALIALYRHVGSNFKVGIGYNFTDFSDDLTDTSYDANGFFIDLTGKY